MSPYLPHRWMVERLPRLTCWFPGASCQHPTPIDITTLGEAHHTAMCNGCGTRWGWAKVWRW